MGAIDTPDRVPRAPAASAENLAPPRPGAYAPSMRRLATALLLALAIAAPVAIGLRAGVASASVSYDSPYSFEQTFGSALRLVRVDLGLKITEKDPDSGYFLFEYTSPESGKRVSQGSIEIVDRKGTVHVAVQLPSMPQYHEQVILDALVKKLAAEHGEPPPKKPDPPAPPPPADAGADAG